MKREIKIKEMKCPFCQASEALKLSDETKDEETCFLSGSGIDYWECPCCGEEIDTELCFENEIEEYKKLADANEWKGLLSFCQSEGYDDFMLLSLAKNYLSNGEFDKAENLAKVLLVLNPGDSTAEELIDRIKNKDTKLRIRATFDEIESAFYFCNFENLYFLDLNTGEIVLSSEINPDSKLEVAIDTEPNRFIRIPLQNSQETYDLMKSFIHEIGEHQGVVAVAENLARAIKQRKPFRKFKDALKAYPKIEERWFAFERSVIKEKICAWLRAHNLICRLQDEAADETN